MRVAWISFFHFSFSFTSIDFQYKKKIYNSNCKRLYDSQHITNHLVHSGHNSTLPLFLFNNLLELKDFPLVYFCFFYYLFYHYEYTYTLNKHFFLYTYTIYKRFILYPHLISLYVFYFFLLLNIPETNLFATLIEG